MTRVLPALAFVLALAALGWAGAAVPFVAAVLVPGVAFVVFVAGFVYRVISWGRAPVPFNITSVAGQQASLPWLHHARLDSPRNGAEVALRLAADVLLFRTLFRNTRTRRGAGRLPVDSSERLLWVAALAFHWSLLLIGLRHLRFVFETPPPALAWLQRWDGFFQVTTPTLFATDVLVLAALAFLLGRRLLDRRLRYLSLPADYFPLLLVAGIAGSGVYMRHVAKVDLLAVKELALGLVTLQPRIPHGIATAVVVHLALVSALLAYLPFSKLMHMGGLFLSPTRTLANDSRRRRHVNPWNPDVEVHTYEQWESEFHDKLVAAGFALEREDPSATRPGARA